MSCKNCGSSNRVNNQIPVIEPVSYTPEQVVGKSDTDAKVRVRYYGGGTMAKKVAKCATCGAAKGAYARVTNEMIMFASDDAPNGMFEQMVEAGRDYWVTEKQAEYLLTLTYTNQAGQVVNKFQQVID